MLAAQAKAEEEMITHLLLGLRLSKKIQSEETEEEGMFKKLLNKFVDHIPETIIVDTMMGLVIIMFARGGMQAQWDYHPMIFFSLCALLLAFYSLGKWIWLLEADNYEAVKFWERMMLVSITAALALFGGTIVAVNVEHFQITDKVATASQFILILLGLAMALVFGWGTYKLARFPYPKIH